MFQKLFSIVALSALLANFAFANDLLAKLSEGVVSDNSVGVKVLSLDEMKEVRGGYVVSLQIGSGWGNANEMYAVALYSGEEFSKGLCPLGQTTCNNHNKTMLTAFNQVVNQKYGEYGLFPVYTIKRQVKVSNLGKPYVFFTYGTGALDANMMLYKFDAVTSGSHLNYNALIKDIAKNYKAYMENQLGGWSVR
ncbi:bacteriocin [Campylobacter upsaliensis]|uniref:bacteriocin n=1 Tax=Campylobacter upsaliensis TaxID=28080 RepID=UPI0012BF0FF1|nr:bacteriocin [Campylobacter upsaliensis]EAK4313491.1 bacteriocin [Campylobacter upsaliensis]EHE9212162.1 bacteriocin [Campylobacter upsaliensis]EHK3563554.1 bacteriocin [Campylobacter upsaliensis]MBT0744289.1 bacteriocin [Campylobacter upsaliensis]